MSVHPFFRGHLLLFEKRDGPAYSPATGLRLLVVFAVLELVVGPRLHGLAWLGIDVPGWARVPLLLAASLLAARFWAKASFEDIGFVPWRKWTPTEKLYFVQVVLLANAIFIALHAQLPGLLGERPGMWGAVAAIVAVQFLWGFHQELTYRGILQTELARRWGRFAGPLAANALFTFGPLHFYHLTSATSWPSTAAILAATFAIGPATSGWSGRFTASAMSISTAGRSSPRCLPAEKEDQAAFS